MYDPSVLFPEAVTLLDMVRRQELAEEMRRVAGYRRRLAGPQPTTLDGRRARRLERPLHAAGDGNRQAAAA
jgi:hypothetical protein